MKDAPNLHPPKGSQSTVEEPLFTQASDAQVVASQSTAMRGLPTKGTAELAYGALSPGALSPEYNGYCVGGNHGGPLVSPPKLQPDMLGKGLLNTTDGDPDPLKLQHIIGLVLAQHFPHSDREWENLDIEGKFNVIKTAINNAFDTVGLPRLTIRPSDKSSDYLQGTYESGSWKFTINRLSLVPRSTIERTFNPQIAKMLLERNSRMEVFDTIAHECQHAVQDFLMLSWFAGHDDSALPGDLRLYKSVMFERVEDYPAYAKTSPLRQLAQHHPTRKNAQVKAMMDGFVKDIELAAAEQTEENRQAKYAHGIEKEGRTAGLAAQQCLAAFEARAKDNNPSKGKQPHPN